MSARSEQIEQALVEHTKSTLKRLGLSSAERDLRFIRNHYGEATSQRVELALGPELTAARRAA